MVHGGADASGAVLGAVVDLSVGPGPRKPNVRIVYIRGPAVGGGPSYNHDE